MIPEPDYNENEANKNNNSLSGKPTTIRQNSNSANRNMPQFDDEGLVVPRKPCNPCAESNERRNLHKEMLWNQKIGKNVLDQKNELERVMAKRKDEAKKKEIEAEKLSRRSSLERRLEEQQLKIRSQEESTDNQSQQTSIASSVEPESEFLKIYSKVKCATINNNDDCNDNNIRKNSTPMASKS